MYVLQPTMTGISMQEMKSVLSLDCCGKKTNENKQTFAKLIDGPYPQNRLH